MTTCAFDGTYMAADSLAVDTWGLKDYVTDKITESEEYLIVGAGEAAQIRKWVWALPGDVMEVLARGYPEYDKEKNDPSLLLFDRVTRRLYRCVGGLFMPCTRTYHAIGSGRDFALAAMACGKTAREAVEIAMSFDNGTGGDIHCVKG